jgi:ribosomal protein S27E
VNETTCAVCQEASEWVTCVPCSNRLRNQVVELRRQYVYLLASRERDQGGGVRVRASKVEAPTPGRLDVLNLLGPAAEGTVHGDDQSGPVPLMAVLESWSQVITEERQLKPVKRTLGELTDRLLRHHEWIVQQPWAGDYALEIKELLTAVRSVTRIDPRRHALHVLCPGCDLMAMVREDHSPWAAECTNCGVKLVEMDYQALVRDAYEAVNLSGEV